MQGDFIERNVGRLSAGYGSCALVKEYGDQFFNLVLGDSSDISSPSGENETFEFDSLLDNTISKVKGKRTLENVTSTFAWNRENLLRLNQLTGKTWEFMIFNKDFTYETFVGELTYRKNDSGAEANTGEYTIIPNAETGRNIDGRPFIRQTLEFAGTIPDEVLLSPTKKTQTVEIGIKQADASATYDVVVEGSDKITATYTNGKLNITADNTLANDAYAMILITAKSETKMKTEGNTDKLRYAPWTVTIAVTYNS